MSFATALTRFRRRQADQFTDRATILRPVGEKTTDPATGQVTQPTVTVGVDRPCKLTAGDAGGTDQADAGDTEVLLVGHLIKFPLEEDVRHGDEVTVTASALNPTDIGRVWVVQSIDRRTWQIARRCVVEELLVPLLNDDEEEVGS